MGMAIRDVDCKSVDPSRISLRWMVRGWQIGAPLATLQGFLHTAYRFDQAQWHLVLMSEERVAHSAPCIFEEEIVASWSDSLWWKVSRVSRSKCTIFADFPVALYMIWRA